MNPLALMRWVRAAWEVAGRETPLLMARYARLTALNRTSRDRIIRKVPEVSQPSVCKAAVSGDVVVPVYNNFADTSALLDALAADKSFAGRIILVHDCSTDSRVGPLLRAFAQKETRAELLENVENAGFVRTCNRGIMASSRDVVILNTDIVLPPGAVERILMRLSTTPGIATVTPLSNCAYGVGLPDLLYGNSQPFGATVEQIDAAARCLPRVSNIELASGIGFCMGMSREAINAIGPFDEAFGLGYGEETDFCMRAVAAGFRHVLAADCYVGHKGGQSFGASWQDLSRKGTLKVLQRHPVFLERVARYLDGGETRALGLAILLRLAEELSRSSDSGREEPELSVEENHGNCAVTLLWRGECFVYRFASRDLYDKSLCLARTA